MKRLRIGIDINEANVVSRVGTGQYCFNLLKHWAKHSELDFHLYHRDPLVADLPPATPHWQYHQIGPTRAWLSLGLPFYLLTHNYHDVLWSPAHYQPAFFRGRSVVTMHDLAYEYFPDLFLPRDLYKLKHWSLRASRRANHLIAVSGATKHDLVSLYDVPEDKITVIHNGYDSALFNTEGSISPYILAQWGLKKHQYLLFLGTIQPRKNVIRLVQAFHLLKESGYPGKLVLAGSVGWLAEETLNVIRHSPHSVDIVMTGYVSDESRVALYRSAEVYVLPSLYEGFGVPLIEAMACGAPVCSANNSSLPEVVGDAGLLFNATDPADISRAISALRQDRPAWVKRSLARAKHFSWAKCAKETLRVLTSGKIG